jgi:hypothetical protein
VTTGAGQAVLVQLLPALAGVTTQFATGVGPVVIAAGHVVVVQLFAALAAAAVHERTGTFFVTFGAGQVFVVQLLPAFGDCGVQVWTGTVEPPTTLQAIVTQPLARVGDCGTQVPLGSVSVIVLQSVSWYPLPAVGATGVQLATVVGPLTIVAAGQVVVT